VVVVVVVVGVIWAGIPLTTVMLPGLMTPDPPEKTAVRLVLDPASMVVGLATKLAIAGAGSTFTVTVAVTGVPAAGVTVRV
jgi:hypothetical protein